MKQANELWLKQIAVLSTHTLNWDHQPCCQYEALDTKITAALKSPYTFARKVIGTISMKDNSRC